MNEVQRRERLDALFAAHARAVLEYARRRTDHTSAADVLSEVFVVAWRRLEEVPEDALPWLLGCARRVLLNERRSERRRRRLLERLSAERPPNPAAAPRLSDGALAQALAALGERDREALLLTEWEGLSSRQAAAVLGCSLQAFWVRSHRARRRLAAELAAAGQPPTPLTLEACND